MEERINNALAHFLESFIKDVAQPLLNLRDIDSIVTGKDADGNSLVYLTFSETEWLDIIVPGVSFTTGLAFFAILLAILYMSVMISKSGINPASRISLLEMVGALIFVAFLIKNIFLFFHVLFMLNAYIINIFTNDITGTLKPYNHEGTIGTLLIWLASLGLSLWANIYYIMRKFSLMIMMIFGPIFISLYLFHPTRTITFTWMRELFSTIIVQSIHVVILWTFVQYDEGIGNAWLLKLIMMAAFIPIAEGIKSIFSMSDSMTGKAAGMAMATGAVGMASIYSAGRSVFGKKNTYDTMSERYGATSREKDTAGQGAREDGSGNEFRTKGEGAPTSKRAQRVLSAGRFAGRLGKAAGIIAGTAAGMPLGPAGTFVGGAIGNTVGEKVGNVSGRFVMAGTDASVSGIKGVASGSKNMYKNVNQSINEEMDKLNPLELDQRTPTHSMNRIGYTPQVYATMSGVGKGIKKSIRIPRTSNSSAENRKNFTKFAGYTGAVVGGEKGLEIGSNLAERFSPSNRKIDAKGFEVADLQNLTQQAPPIYDSKGNVISSQPKLQSLRVAITQDSSSMLGTFKNTDGSTIERRISRYGAGDQRLKTGQIVYKDYHLNNGRIMEGENPLDQNPYYYQEDSQGAKVRTNYQMNVNPYDYFNNKNKGSEKYFRPDRFKQGIV